ncbi:MAG TPA: SDR family NAD(P)-dependent oxidoreductase, partial [Polyangiaceae bacterium]|nr:SDR family NAD(P)-dependent oxidoreductase [Polyangiaceae bacterium]
MRRLHPNVLCVRAGDSFSRCGTSDYVLNPTSSEDYLALFQELAKTNSLPGNVLHCFAYSLPPTRPRERAGREQAIDRLFWSQVALAKAWGRLQPRRPLECCVLLDALFSVTGEERFFPEQAVALGPARVAPCEYLDLRCRVIDVPREELTGGQAAETIAGLVAEFLSDSVDEIVALRRGKRWIQEWERRSLRKATGAPPRLRAGGCYLITGGLGGLGFTFARFLGESLRARLVLLGRSPFPPRDAWNLYLSDAHSLTGRRIKDIIELEAAGARVLPLTADVAEEQSMRAVLLRVKEEFGEIDGVIHAAGIAGGRLIEPATRTDVESVLRPKVMGTLVLERLLSLERLDFFLLCSSLNTLLPKPGQVDYLAANAFLDAFADVRGASRPVVCAVNWGAWCDVGMSEVATLPARLAPLRQLGARCGISSAAGVRILQELLTAPPTTRVAVTPNDLPSLLNTRPTVDAYASLLPVEAGAGSAPNGHDAAVSSICQQNVSSLESRLCTLWQDLLGLEHVGVQDDFFKIGGNSLFALELLAKVKRAFGTELSIGMLYQHPRLSELASALRDASSTVSPPLATTDHVDIFPVTSQQRKFLLLDHLMPGDLRDYVVRAFRVEGLIDRQTLEQSLSMLAASHPSLRTTFEERRSLWFQRIHPQLPIDISYSDTTAVQVPRQKAAPYCPLHHVGVVVSSVSTSCRALERVG